MAAGVSITETKAQIWLFCLVLGVCFMVSGCEGVYNSYMYNERDFVCPPNCDCYLYQPRQIPSTIINCTVSSFGPHVDYLMTESPSNTQTGWAHYNCSFWRTGVPLPDSTLWDGAFAGLTQLRELIFNACSFKDIKGSAFRGLNELRQLVVYGASISVLDSDLLTYTPKVDFLQVAASGLTLVPALCRTGSQLRVLNLSSNALSNFDAAGVRCTGAGTGNSRGPPLAGLETLDLSNNQIDSWPTWLQFSLPGLMHLALGGNKISSFGRAPLSGFSRLSYLDISNNDIPSFEDDFFSGASSSLGTLILSKNKVRALPPNMLRGLPRLHKVDFSDMNLSGDLWDQFRSSSAILEMNLSHNKLGHIDEDVLSNLPDIQELHLNNDQITAIPRETFKRNFRLLILDLSHNKIETVPAQAFSGATKLEILHLQNNEIKTLERGVFNLNTDLLVLELSHNFLSDLPNRLLASQSRLEVLDLSFNQISQLEDDVFSYTVNLRSLNVSHNRLIQLPIGTLPSRIEYLDFSYNDASGQISSNMLRALSRVKEIHLNHNKINSLPLQAFAGCSQLKYLDLSQNRIGLVEESMFSGATDLEEINLSFNNLNDVNRVFTNLKKLKVLNLSRNRLLAIQPHQFPVHILTIDLSNNRIASISDSSFKSLTRIKTVDLSANNLTRIDRQDMEISYSLVASPEFILRYNPLVCDCELGWLKDWLTGTIKNKETLPTFRVAYSLDCWSPSTKESQSVAKVDRSAFLCEYKKFCSEDCTCCKFTCYCEYQCPAGCKCFRGDSVMKVQRVECQAAGLTTLPKLPDGATEVRLDGNNIPDLPKFKFVAMKDVVDVFLNNSNLQTIHNCSFWGMKVARRLYLNDNRLSELPVGAFTGLYELEQLFLHNNNLHIIETGSLLAPPMLRTLTLHSNELVTLTMDDLYELVNRSSASNVYSNRSCSRSRRDVSNTALSLTLRDNPWTCEKSFACGFLSYLLTFSESIEDLQSIQCVQGPQVVAFVPGDGVRRRKENSGSTNISFPVHKTRTGRRILDLQLDVCSTPGGNQSLGNVTGARLETNNSDKEKFVLIAACVLVVLIAAIVVAVFLNRHLLQVICFTRFGCRAFKPGKDAADDDRPYDAFLCHSNKDDEFVLQQLVPRLENGEKPFRLCLHCRDIPSGAYMGDSIVRSVQASKRTVLVLSENFLESEYCKFEFQVAHEQLMREKKSRMIIILLGNLDLAKVKDDDIKLYLRTRTYLKVGEALFWEKLLFAMPDVKVQQHRRRPSGAKGNNAGLVATTRLPSNRELEYMDRDRRMSEQQQLPPMEQQHLFELQQQQQLLLQKQQQQQHPQAMAQTPLFQYPHHNYPPHNHHPHQHEHHQHLLHHQHYHGHSPYSHYEEQQVLPPHQQVLLRSQPHPHHSQPYTQQSQPQQHQQHMANHDRPSRQEMYEIPALDSAPDSHYNLAKTGGVPPLHDINRLGPVISGYPGLNGLQGGFGGVDPLRRGGGGAGGDGHASSGSGSLKSTHVNSAFNNSDDSSTSGYHNGSADCCSSCGGHYEEVGPGSTSIMNTPIKIVNQRGPPPVPRIPKEGFVPIDRDESVNTC
ncbi:hypothetical protein EGW08_019255 [Elysia chlorotica]|uniref:TIR domain-containing protein n=1 Tax=Elysia chlorotica TaxID=188477 RepID=A0A433SUL2_ELYCH|nr:hypothetical protein EGW08_019255 [Elysia chlorotica]